jgi:hypothetical protein
MNMEVLGWISSGGSTILWKITSPTLRKAIQFVGQCWRRNSITRFQLEYAVTTQGETIVCEQYSNWELPAGASRTFRNVHVLDI